MTSDIIQALEWRYAVNKFDTTKKVSPEDIEKIKKILQLSVSSNGIQPWKFFIIENPKIREKLVEVSYGQDKVLHSSHLIVLARRTDVNEGLVDQVVQASSNATGVSIENLSGYKNSLLHLIGGTEEQNKTMATNQVYIALGTLITSLATLGIDACPMGGFIPEKYDEILGLTEKNAASVVIVPIGYRSKEDDRLQRPKARLSQDIIIEEIQ